MIARVEIPPPWGLILGAHTTLRYLLSFAILCLCVTLVQAAGFIFIEVPPDASGPALRRCVVALRCTDR
jgi:hypothetical protein